MTGCKNASVAWHISERVNWAAATGFGDVSAAVYVGLVVAAGASKNDFGPDRKPFRCVTPSL